MELRQFRSKKGLTQDQMSKLVGISKSMYEKLEYNQASPSIKTIKKFKKAFNDFDINIFLKQNHK